MTSSPVYELREAAERIRDTPACTTVHDGCECEFHEQMATWFERLADDLPLALETARKVLASTAPAPKPGLDFLPELPSSLATGSSLKVYALKAVSR